MDRAATTQLAPLSKRVHRAKTHGRWKVRQLEAGILHWTSPNGYQYLDTPHGTHNLGPQDTPAPTYQVNPHFPAA